MISTFWTGPASEKVLASCSSETSLYSPDRSVSHPVIQCLELSVRDVRDKDGLRCIRRHDNRYFSINSFSFDRRW